MKVSGWVVLDNMGICPGITATFIRLGNLMNSEIIGKVTDMPWAFIFVREDQYPRHPGQLYEALAYFCFFLLILFIYKKRGPKERRHRFLFRSLPYSHLHLPFLHRIYEGNSGGIRGRSAYGYGTDIEHSAHHRRCMEHRFQHKESERKERRGKIILDDLFSDYKNPSSCNSICCHGEGFIFLSSQ